MPIHTAIKPQITENSVWNTAGEKPCVSHRKSRWTPAALSLLKQWDREKRDTEFSNMERKEWLTANSTTGKPVFQESKWGEKGIFIWNKTKRICHLPQFFLLPCTWVFCLHTCPCTMCTSGILRGQNRMWDSWNWSYRQLWRAGHWICVLCKGSHCL